jgi:PHP family Zn ribbon phosphoesterase
MEGNMKKALIVVAVVLVLALGGFAWYYLSGPCGILAVNQSIEQLLSLDEEFNDAVKVAESTSRISLSGPISELQAIAREINDLKVPACLEPAKKYYYKSADNEIMALLAFASQEKESVVSSYIYTSLSAYGDAQDEVAKIKACAPFCVQDPYKVTP